MTPTWLGRQLLAAIAALAMLQSVEAAPTTFQFTGSVSEPSTFTPGTPDDPFAGTIRFGTAITGQYIFDPAAVDTISEASAGSYHQSGPPYGMTVTIGGNVFSVSEALAINVQDGNADFYGVLACSGSLSSSVCAGVPLNDGDLQISLQFFDVDGTTFASDGLPLAPPDLANFSTSSFILITQLDGAFHEIDGTLTSLRCVGQCAAAVPEPATLLLVGGGIAMLAARRRRW